MTDFAVFIIVIILAAAVVGFPAVCIFVCERKKRNATRPVEYYPPRGYSPIDVMLSLRGAKSVPRELFNPLMLYWAQNGLITIEEDCKRGLKLTKIKNIEDGGKPGSRFFASPTFSLQQQLFNDMFRNSDVFCTLAATEADGKKLEIFTDGVKTRAKKTVTDKTKKLKYACVGFAGIAFVLSALFIGQSIGSAAITLIFPIIGIFTLWAMLKFAGIPDVKIRAVLVIFFCIVGGVPTLMVFFASSVDSPNIGVAVSIVAIVAAVVLSLFVLTERIDHRTSEDLEIYGRIRSFETFLVDAELDRLETLVEDDPDYFYDVLPYCYIFGITEKLKPKFDRVALDGPSWYLGNFRETLMF